MDRKAKKARVRALATHKTKFPVGDHGELNIPAPPPPTPMNATCLALYLERRTTDTSVQDILQAHDRAAQSARDKAANALRQAHRDRAKRKQQAQQRLERQRKLDRDLMLLALAITRPAPRVPDALEGHMSPALRRAIKG